jgi:uncharacterized repeat protein (TIGR01451 family)
MLVSLSKHWKTALTAMLLFTVSFAYADNKHDKQVTQHVSAANPSNKLGAEDSFDNRSTPNSFVALDFSIQAGESWDAEDKPSNITTNCINGDTITGFEYNNVTIQTFGGSYFSEAIIYFSDSNGEDGLRLAIGAFHETAGIETFNSNGIIDISDIGFDDVVSLNDNKFLMQFYEIVDDAQNAIDARYTNGILKVWGIDLEASSDCPFVEAVVEEEADLSVSYVFVAEKINFVGEEISFDITIDNEGGTEATNIVLTNNLSEKLRFLELKCSDGTVVSEGDSRSFDLPNIAAGGSLSCTLKSQVIEAGQVFNDISIDSDIDSDTDNNSANMEISGAAVAVPVNSGLTLLLLAFGLLFLVRRTSIKNKSS